MMPSNHLIFCCSFSSCLQSFPASGYLPMSRLFASGGKSTGASASAGMSPSSEYSELISFRMDWFDLLAVQRTLKNLLQHHSSKASILQRSTFFIVQLSHLDVTTGKTIALTIWTFVSKVMSLLFQTLSWFGNPGKTQISYSSAQTLPKSVKSPDPHSSLWDCTHHNSCHHRSLTQLLAPWHRCGGLCTGSLSPICKAGTLASFWCSLRLPFLSTDSLPQTPFATIHSPHPCSLPLIARPCFIL